MFNPNKPFNDLPDLPPVQQLNGETVAIDLETKSILKKLVAAASALSALKQAADLIPNKDILINTLPRLEAQASSEIENIVTTTDELFKYEEIEDAKDPATKEALRYRKALWNAYKDIQERPIRANLAEEICSEIKGTDMKVRTVPGTKLANGATGETVYTPPEGEDLLRDKLSNWERFLNGGYGPIDQEDQELHALIRMAVMHYQFEAIHPFTDGNGRTGRILNTLYLTQEKLLDLPILYLSRYIIKNKDAYYDGLLAVTDSQAWEPWVLYMLDAVETTATWTTAKIQAIRELSVYTADFVKNAEPTRKFYTRELIDVIFQQPYCRIHNLVDSGIAKRQTASEYLKKLVTIGVLSEVKLGRERLFMHQKLLELLSKETNDFKPYPEQV